VHAAPRRPNPFASPATRELVEELVTSRRRWSDFIDPAIGVIFVQYTTSDSEPGIFTAASHLCGEAAVRELERRRPALETAIQMDEIFRCTTGPGPGTCELGIAGEFAGTTRLLFTAGGASGLVLDTVEDVNSTYAPEDEATVLARLRAHERGARCP
jgi:hypothetical protein